MGNAQPHKNTGGHPLYLDGGVVIESGGFGDIDPSGMLAKAALEAGLLVASPKAPEKAPAGKGPKTTKSEE